MTVTVREVAQAAGVSQATAARALGGYGYASGAARERVLESARCWDTHQMRWPARWSRNATMTVGVVVGDIENPFFATAARGLTDVFDGHGYTVLLANADEDRRTRGARCSMHCASRRVDGLVVVPAPGAPARPRSWRRACRWCSSTARCAGVAADAVMVANTAGARAAVAHLLGLGPPPHRRSSRTRPRSRRRPSGSPATGGRCAAAGVGVRRAGLDRRLDPGRRARRRRCSCWIARTGRPRCSPPTTS